MHFHSPQNQSYAVALSSIPFVNTWDDHDIFDGFGSYDDEIQVCVYLSVSLSVSVPVPGCVPVSVSVYVPVSVSVSVSLCCGSRGSKPAFELTLAVVSGVQGHAGYIPMRS
jgi:hypothetical protein